MTGHLVWDAKMDFSRQGWCVLDRHKTPDPIGSTFAGVVSHESGKIAFIFTALNGLMCAPLICRMPIYRLHCHRKIIFFVALNLAWKILEELLSSTGHYTVTSWQGRTLGPKVLYAPSELHFMPC